MFPGGVGKTTTASFPQLLTDVEERIFARFPDEAWIYPGHGNDTDVRAERPHLSERCEHGW